MEPQQLLADLESLTPDEARTVAELIAFFKQRHQSGSPIATELLGQPVPTSDPAGAILLPPLDLSTAPTTWPENSFMDPAFYGAWANRTDIKDSTAFVRELRDKQWGVH